PTPDSINSARWPCFSISARRNSISRPLVSIVPRTAMISAGMGFLPTAQSMPRGTRSSLRVGAVLLGKLELTYHCTERASLHAGYDPRADLLPRHPLPP